MVSRRGAVRRGLNMVYRSVRGSRGGVGVVGMRGGVGVVGTRGGVGVVGTRCTRWSQFRTACSVVADGFWNTVSWREEKTIADTGWSRSGVSICRELKL